MAEFPCLDLPDQDGRIRRLDEFKDRRYLVVYFYPMDNTRGCTLEAKGFTALLDEFHRLGTEIIGVSAQSPKSHTNFCARHDLRITLLSDEDKRLVKTLGIFRFTGTAKRTIYLIRSDGEIVKKWRDVKPAVHAKEVVHYIQSLSQTRRGSP